MHETLIKFYSKALSILYIWKSFNIFEKTNLSFLKRNNLKFNLFFKKRLNKKQKSASVD